MKGIGVILIVLGIGLTIITSGKFFTTEKVVDLGKVEITREKPNYVSWSPILGILIVGVGGVKKIN